MRVPSRARPSFKPQERVEPCRHRQQSGDEGQEALRFGQVEHRTGECHHRECPDAPRYVRLIALVDLFEGKAEEQGQREQQYQALGEFDRRHRRLHHAAPSGMRIGFRSSSKRSTSNARASCIGIVNPAGRKR